MSLHGKKSSKQPKENVTLHALVTICYFIPPLHLEKIFGSRFRGKGFGCTRCQDLCWLNDFILSLPPFPPRISESFKIGGIISHDVVLRLWVEKCFGHSFMMKWRSSRKKSSIQRISSPSLPRFPTKTKKWGWGERGESWKKAHYFGNWRTYTIDGPARGSSLPVPQCEL